MRKGRLGEKHIRFFRPAELAGTACGEEENSAQGSNYVGQSFAPPVFYLQSLPNGGKYCRIGAAGRL